MAAAKTHLSSHLSSAVTMKGVPGRLGDTGQPGESQVNYIILFKTFTNIPIVSHLYFHTWSIWRISPQLFGPKCVCLALESFVHLVKDIFALGNSLQKQCLIHLRMMVWVLHLTKP